MDKIQQLFDEHQTDPLVQDILLQQHLSYEHISQILKDQKFPFESQALELILDRLYKAKVLKEKVVIVGDYDADGIMSTTILYKALKSFEIEVGFYIPDRLKEGYGINKNIVDQVISKQYELIICVDNGIVAFEALEYAKEKGIEVVVVDHHTINADYDFEFDYLLHPKYLPYGYNDLCGAGLALLIAERIAPKAMIPTFYAYAMIATIADMVSVFGHNRNIIKNGLYTLNKKGDMHIENLMNSYTQEIDQTMISFQVVPKLNTFGRLADLVNVNNSVRYFLLTNETEIKKSALEITAINQKRITLTKDSFERFTQIKKYGTMNVLINENIHEGLTGLIAGRHLNSSQEPILVFTKVNDIYKGSGRSPIGYDLYELLSPYRNLFVSFGGHKQACGISIKIDQMDAFLELLTKNSEDIMFIPQAKHHHKLTLDQLTSETVKHVNMLEPFGTDFKRPFFSAHFEVTQRPQRLKDKYLKWVISPSLEMLSFKTDIDISELEQKQTMNALVNLQLNTFKNRTKVNLIVEDFLD